jgi:diacylglycerol kinase
MRSFSYALNGIKNLLRTEHNAGIHIASAVLVIFLGFVFKISKYEWCLLVLAIGFVLAAEIINTAIECLTDIVSPEYSEKAGKVKDLAAGAVLIASITAFAIGLIILLNAI